MLRESTANTSANELKGLQASKAGVRGPRSLDHGNGSGQPASERAEYRGEHGSLIVHEPYRSIDQVLNPVLIPTLRRQSAKQLIHRFESMIGASETVQVRPTCASSETGSRDVHPPFLTVVSPKTKGRSLSNSLRNFMSVFKKKKDRESDDDEPIPPYALGLDVAIPGECISLAGSQVVSSSSKEKTTPALDEAAPMHSGVLLYLSRPPAQSPVWVSCTVVLYDSHLSITWYTMRDTPSSHIIQLDGLVDVRSLYEHVSRPGHKGDLKSFELSFQDRTRETFAATSSQERARWIGAIWDVVLRSHRGRGEIVHGSKPSEALTIRTDVAPESLPSPEEARSEYTSSSAPKTPLTQSTLQQTPPLTPIAKSPRYAHSPLSISPPRPPSQLSIPHSRSKSPSIANLGTLSVVTQRLAQIERPELASPPSSAVTSSSAGTALRRAKTEHPAEQRRPFAHIEKLQGENVRGNRSKIVETPSTDGSIVIPLPHPPNALLSETASVRSAFKRSRAGPQSLIAPTPLSSPTRALSLAAPVASLRADLSDLAVREHVENPPTSPLAIDGIGPQLAPLEELIKETAAKHYDQTAGLGEQIISLQRDIHTLPNEIQVLLRRAMVAAKPASSSNGHSDNASFRNVLTSLEALRKQILAKSEHSQVDSLVKMFEDLQTQLATLAPLLIEKLTSIEHGQTQLWRQAIQEAEQQPCLTDARAKTNVDASHSPCLLPPTKDGLRDESSHPSVDLSDIYSKLDELASLYRSSTATVSARMELHDATPLQASDVHSESEKFQAILDHLKVEEGQRKLQLDQQTDSVRYLNELNSWLDAFVNGGTVHIQSVAANVEQLCSHLGVFSEDNTDGQPQGMLSEIRHLVSSVNAKASDEDQLQAFVAELMNTVREQMKNSAEQRTTLVTDSVLEIVNRQRQEQEQMLRALSAELTNEIRGERLRFVEAMKEATAINVQAHVEHFKAELGREVAAMTQDVGRLHQEKQAVEQQIADLFAFYSKQKQEAENNARCNAPPKSTGFSDLQNLPSATPKRPRRPLPHPVFQKKD